VVNPEFMREGSAIDDTMYATRAVCGYDRDACSDEAAQEILGLWPVAVNNFATCWETAESVKIMDNTWHALKICFANEMGRWLRRATAETDEAFTIFRADHYLNLGKAYLQPGWAYGGSCLPKDVEAMEEIAGYELPLLSAIESSNTNHIEFIQRCITTLRPKNVVIYGTAFKQGTNDNRGSQSIELALRLGRKIIATTTEKIKECYDADVIVLTHAPTKKELLDLSHHVKKGQTVIDVVHVTKPQFAKNAAFRWESPYWH
jgi:GDP-mannose 6-dehydrogenase